MNAAHIDNSGNIQTVYEHSHGTARKAVGYAKEVGAESIAMLQGLLHDMGKMCHDFDGYIKGENGFKRGEIDHCYAGARYILETADELSEDLYDVSRFIAHTIVSHHGLHDWYNSDGRDYLKKRISENRNYHEILSKIDFVVNKAEMKELLLKADSEYRVIRSGINRLCAEAQSKTKSRMFYLGMFERLIQSILIDADRTDTADFMAGQSTEKLFSEKDYEQIWGSMQLKLEEKLAGFEDKKDSISVQRRSISQRCADFAERDVKICRLIVPTGGGKTLSSLRFAVKACLLHKKKRVIYVAPYMSILEQNSDEIRSISSEVLFTEHHSNALNEIEGEEELHEYELRTEKWDNPIIATTMVQFFNSLFSSKTSAVRRMHRLCNSVIIIDEVQSIPGKCVNLFNLAMNFISHVCNSTVVLCSATQPGFDETEYPLLIDKNESMTGNYEEDFKAFERTSIIPNISKYGMTYEEVAEFCKSEYEKAGNLLLIVNTKTSASRIYQHMSEMSYSVVPEILHLSTNMCPAHRGAAIDKIRNSHDKPFICISTQLIEAGVDVSFKCVVRSLAGLDSINQAAGRCNRHGENFGKCPVYVVNIRDENISKLTEIKKARETSERIIHDKNYHDYSSVNTISAYYRGLFRTIGNELSYPIDNPDTTIINLLSKNEDWYNKSLNLTDYNDGCNKYHAQAFKTAGDNFRIIDENTVDIIVPYDDSAMEIISALNSDIPFYEIKELLRKSQKYMVGVYRQMHVKLSEMDALYQLKCGAIALRSEYYNPELGVVMDGSQMELLCF